MKKIYLRKFYLIIIINNKFNQINIDNEIMQFFRYKNFLIKRLIFF